MGLRVCMTLVYQDSVSRAFRSQQPDSATGDLSTGHALLSKCRSLAEDRTRCLASSLLEMGKNVSSVTHVTAMCASEYCLAASSVSGGHPILYSKWNEISFYKLKKSQSRWKGPVYQLTIPDCCGIAVPQLSLLWKMQGPSCVRVGLQKPSHNYFNTS